MQAEGRNNHANMECVPAVCYTAFLSLALALESEYRSLAARALIMPAIIPATFATLSARMSAKLASLPVAFQSTNQ